MKIGTPMSKMTNKNYSTQGFPRNVYSEMMSGVTVVGRWLRS